MATESGYAEKLDRSVVLSRSREIIIGYPSVSIAIFFAIPLLMLFVYSFYENISGGYFQPAFTFENYIRFFTTQVYIGRLIFTLELSAIVTILVGVVGYPITYYTARIRSTITRRAIIVTLLASMWITYVIRAYAWTVLLSRGAIISQIALALGLISEPQSFVPGYGALVVALVYVLLPFYILTLYPSIKQIDPSLIEASKTLGAGPLRTFVNVTLPLSKTGLLAGAALTYILTTGTYVLPTMLGKPKQWTLAVIIGGQINQELNIPFGAAMSFVLMVIIVILLAATVRLTNQDIMGLGGG